MIERFDNASAIVAGQATPTTHATPDDWIGWELGLTPAESTPIGSVEISANAPAFPVIPDSEDSEALDFADPLQEVSPSPAELQGTLEWIEVDELGNAYLHEMERQDAAVLYEYMSDVGETSAAIPAAEAPPPANGLLMEIGASSQRHGRPPQLGADLEPSATWSDGDDSRTKMAVANGFSVNHWPFRTIGHLPTGATAGGCTGTLIGARTIVTSAHCVWDGTNVIQHTFRARRDPSNSAPHGTGTTTNYIFPSGYITDTTCGTPTANASCFKNDIAVVRLSATVGTTTGVMGFGHFTTTTIEGYEQIFMRGYPACDATGDWANAVPANCVDFALYGHANSEECDVAQWAYAGCRADGWYCTFDVSCDGSAGQSGSAFYTYETSLGNGPVVLGVYSKSECAGPACGTNHFPNGATRITPDIAYMLSYWKSQWGG